MLPVKTTEKSFGKISVLAQVTWIMGKLSRINGPYVGESTGDLWNPFTKGK